MVTYIYFVKCPNCEDEHFDFFDEAKGYAMRRLGQKPIITQTEINRNDFGECTDHCDLGTVWSWEDVVGKDFEAEPVEQVFTKDDLRHCDCDGKCGADCKCGKHVDPEFDEDDSDFRFINEELLESRRISFNNKEDQQEFFKLCKETGMITAADLDRFMKDHDADDGDLLDALRAYKDELDLADAVEVEESCERKPIPEGMTIEELVEEMEKNEDDVECTWCNELYDKSECRYEVDLGWLCSRCEMAIKSRGETLTFKENNYWDFLDESVDDTRTLAELVKDSINHLANDLSKDPWADDFADDVIADIETNYDTYVPENAEHYGHWCSAVASEVSRQVNSDYKLDEGTKEVHDLGNEYDGGYPDELEDADTYSARLELCPECGAEHAYDKDTGICINCGFNI